MYSTQPERKKTETIHNCVTKNTLILRDRVCTGRNKYAQQIAEWLETDIVADVSNTLSKINMPMQYYNDTRNNKIEDGDTYLEGEKRAQKLMVGITEREAQIIYYSQQ